MRLLTLAVVIASAAASLAQTSGGFHSTCAPDWKWDFGGWSLLLAATCPDGGGRNHTSWLNVDDCVSNSEGKLVGKESGRMSYSCQDCVRTGASGLSCVCETTFGRRNSSTVDLDTIVKNVDGILGCYSLLGIEVKSLDDAPG